MRGLLRVLRWIGTAAAIVAIAASLVVVSAYALLQSEAGRARVVEFVNRQLSTPGGTQVRIGRLDGDLPGRIVIHEVTFSDGDGIWLQFGRGSVSWRPTALLAGKLSIALLDLDGLRVLRRPRPSQGESDAEFRWPELPLRVSIRRFSLRDAVLGQAVLGEEVIFRATGDIAIEAPDLVRTSIAVMRTDGVSGQVQLEAVLQPRSKKLRFDVALNEAGGGLLARALTLEGLPPVSIQVSGDGPLHELRGTARMRAGDLASVQTGFTIDVSTRPTLELAGRARVARLVGERFRHLLSDEVAFGAYGELTEGGIVLRRTFLANQLARVEVSGELRDRAADFDVAVHLNDLAPLAHMAGLPLHGQASVRLRIRSDDIRRTVAASANATLSDPLAPESPLQALIGSRVSIAGDFAFDADGHWAVRDLHVTGDAVELEANVTMSTDALALDGEYQLTLPRLAALSGVVKTPLAGKLTVNGKIGGRLAAPKLTARMRSPALSVDEVLLGAVEARVTVAQLSNELSGHFDLAIDHPRLGKVGVASRFSGVTDDTFYFHELVVESQDTKLTGAMAVNLSNATVTGKMAGQALSLASWSDLAGHTLSGSASVVLDMRASGANQQIDVALDVDGLNATLGPEQILTVDTLTASARVEDLFGAPTGGLRLVAGDSKFSEFQLENVVFEARADGPRHASGSLQARGDLSGPFDLQVLGDYQAVQAGFVVTVSELGASLSGQSVKLTKPTRFEHDGETAALSETILSVAGGTLTVSGEIGSERIGARLALERISLSDLDAVITMADVTGTLSGHFSLSGSRRAPVAEMELRSADMRSAHTTLAAAPPASARLRGDWRDGRLQLTASLTEIADTRIDARASLPLQLDPVTLALAMPADGTVDGNVKWSGELGPVWDLLSPNEDRFTGPGDLALTLAGTVANPQVSGHFQVAGGRYENVLTGTTLSDVELRLVGDGDKLMLEQLTAGDDKKGTLEGSGTIDFIPARSYPTNLRVDFSDMLLVARDDLTLNASGNLLFEGTLSSALLSGEIVTGQSELSLAGTLPPQVVELEVAEVNITSAAHATIKAPAGAADPSVVILDLDISVPGRAFVRGLGLDSEWMGDVKISGNANAPNVAAVLSPVRGNFSLMGKTFRLERGAIRFTGSDDVDPLLDLTAEHTAKRLTAMVRVTGSASDPKIALTSRPPLPESEIAFQVLFGTDSSNLSPAQSLQLASAIATYSGTPAAPSVFSMPRGAPWESTSSTLPNLNRIPTPPA